MGVDEDQDPLVTYFLKLLLMVQICAERQDQKRFGPDDAINMLDTL